MKHIYLILLLLIFSNSRLFSQDKIVRNNNEKIYCKIISINNEEIRFSLSVKGSYAETSVNLNDVMQIVITNDNMPIIASDLKEENQKKIKYKERKTFKLRNTLPFHGFFIEAGYANLFVNGKGHVEDYDFNILDDWFVMDVIETEYEIDIHFLFCGGFGLKDRSFSAVRPLIGYRFSPKLSFTVNYSHYFKQQNYQEETYTEIAFPHYKYSVVTSLQYTQRGFQFLFNYTPVPATGFYLAGGFEVVRLKLKADNKFKTSRQQSDFSSHSFEMNGSDFSSGFLIGIGNELPVFFKKLTLNTSILYSFNNYSGNQLFQEERPGPVINPDATATIKIGGVIINVGLRKYF